MRKFLLWDHDGVLVDTERWYFAATQKCLATLGVDLDEPTYLGLMAKGRSCFELAQIAGHSAERIQAGKADRNKLYQDFLQNKEIEIAGVSEVLHELRSKFRMAIVSTSRRPDFELIHKNRNLKHFFEFVLNLGDYEKAKPAPDPYLAALRRFRAEPKNAIAIEDSERGLRSALAAGVDCIIVHNPFTARQDFTGARLIVPRIQELPSALANFE